MDLSNNFEGYDPNERNVVQEGWDIAKYGIRAWIDSETRERVGGDTTGDSVVKSGPRRNAGNGEVSQGGQANGTAVSWSPQVAGFNVGQLILLGLVAGGIFIAASD